MIHLLGVLGSTLVDSWADEKKAKTKAKVKAMESDVHWEKHMADASASSWKDEFWTILLAIPLFLAFIPTLSHYAEDGFKAIEQMPDWYRYYVGIAIGAAFGVRQLKDYLRKK